MNSTINWLIVWHIYFAVKYTLLALTHRAGYRLPVKCSKLLFFEQPNQLQHFQHWLPCNSCDIKQQQYVSISKSGQLGSQSTSISPSPSPTQWICNELWQQHLWIHVAPESVATLHTHPSPAYRPSFWGHKSKILLWNKLIVKWTCPVLPLPRAAGVHQGWGRGATLRF